MNLANYELLIFLDFDGVLNSDPFFISCRLDENGMRIPNAQDLKSDNFRKYHQRLSWIDKWRIKRVLKQLQKELNQGRTSINVDLDILSGDMISVLEDKGYYIVKTFAKMNVECSKECWNVSIPEKG